MTVDPPRRLRPRAAQRNKTITTQTKGAPSAKGSTAAARPVSTKHRAQQYVPPGKASGLVPANPPSGASDVAVNPAGGAEPYKVNTWDDSSDIALALAVDGDDYPRLTMFVDSAQGILFGPGDVDAYNDSTHFGIISLDGSGETFSFVGSAGKVQFGRTDSKIVVDTYDYDGDVLVETNSTRAVVQISCTTGQTALPLTVRGPGSVTAVFKVAPNGTATSAAAFCPGAFATADRPIGVPVGGMVFDTDLGIPIWSDGFTGWRDATGTAV